MTDENDEKGEKIYRHKVIKAITDKPGMVVYVDDIVDELTAHGVVLTSTKVASAVRRFKVSYPEIGDEIQVVAPGQAWRHVPNKKATQATRTTATSQPRRTGRVIPAGNAFTMTAWVREYLVKNVGKICYIQEIVDAVNTERAAHGETYAHVQVSVGINNARHGNEYFKERLITVLPGRAWTYREQPITDDELRNTLNAVVQDNNVQSTSSMPVPVAATPVPSVNATSADDNEMMLIEQLGNTSDGAMLVRDENGRLYTLRAI
jgi:hypothetical protein